MARHRVACGPYDSMKTLDTRALELFEHVLALEPDARDAFLRAACAGNDALLTRVRLMLQADERAHPWLDLGTGALGEGLWSHRRETWDGHEFGPYRLLHELGRGGMGIVYLAERIDVGVRLAIKLVGEARTAPERMARFDYERRALARLEHPHIARFLDAGVTDDGTAWLAMERVEGSPIDVHCDARKLGIRERLELMERVTDAVAHAHRHLLVHRDIKPSNVLVSDAGVPKLVDFGIAKLLAPSPAGDDVDDGWCGPMTPEYASPEQVRCEPLSTASDVYQLGILLHELVTGRRPVRADGEPLRHVDRAVGTLHMRPSALVSGARRREVRGDIDCIIDKALAPDPAQRYVSARELADDLQRYRTGHPIAARPATVTYRIGKLVRRHRAASALATALVLIAIASAGMLFAQAQRVAAERDRAEQVSSVLHRLVLTADPRTPRTDTAAGRVVLHQVMEQARAGLATQPETWSRILLPIGSIHRNRDQPDTAIALWRASIAALEPRVAANHPVLLETQGLLGALLVVRGQTQEGMAILERMLTNARQLPHERRDYLASALYEAAFGRQVAGDDAGARRLYDETLPLLLSLPDSGKLIYDRTLLNLGFLAGREGDAKSSESYFRRALERRMRRDGIEHERTLNAMGALARTLLARGAVDEAAPLADTVLTVRRRLFSPTHSAIADALDMQALVLAARGRYSEAESTAREALAIYRSTYGDEHFIVGFALAHVADVIAQQQRTAEAIELQREAVRTYRASAGDAHPGTLDAIVSLADLELELGNTAQAETLYREAVPRLDSLRAGTPLQFRPLAGLGTLLARTGRCEEAVPWLRNALALAASGPPDHMLRVAAARAALDACTHNNFTE
jgi:tetratricopeptide (TPR) repeat protein